MFARAAVLLLEASATMAESSSTRFSLEGVFAMGQVYVLVSRVTDPNNFLLVGVPPKDLLEDIAAALLARGVDIDNLRAMSLGGSPTCRNVPPQTRRSSRQTRTALPRKWRRRNRWRSHAVMRAVAMPVRRRILPSSRGAREIKNKY